MAAATDPRLPSHDRPVHGRVLIIEDDDTLAHLLRSVLEWSFEDVAVCHDVDTALAEIQQRHFDALVLDIGLGHRSGIGFLRAARAAGCTAPTVVTTALADELAERDIDSLGIEAVLCKPYPLETLEATLLDLVATTSKVSKVG